MSYGISLFTEPEFGMISHENYFQNIHAEEGVLEIFADEHGNCLFNWIASLPDGHELSFNSRDETLKQLRSARLLALDLDEGNFQCGKEPFIEELDLAIELAEVIPSTTQIALGIC